jgi:serine/threonine protein kinase
VAEPAFRHLYELYDQALKALHQGTYGQVAPLVTIESKRGKHELIRLWATGDLCSLYTAVSVMKGGGEKQSISKVAELAADSDLMQAEAKVLQRLRGSEGDPKRHAFVPELLDSFAYSEKGKPTRHMNVLVSLDGFYNLRQVREAYPSGVHPLDVAWMWRRLLVALDYAHGLDIVHGAVLPQHVMLLPDQHGLVLVDWCYAATADGDGKFPPIKAIVQQYRPWYTSEVLNKQPPSPATDLAMAARCMIELMGGDPVTGTLPEALVPKPFRAYFKGCLTAKQSARPNDAWELLGEFDKLLERIGEPYFPRRFRPFAMPRGVA